MYRRQAGLPRYGPAMDDEDGYFGERVAARYDKSSADMFELGVVGGGRRSGGAPRRGARPGGGRRGGPGAARGRGGGLGAGGRAGTDRTAAGPPRRPGPRDRLVAGDDCPPGGKP